MRISMGLFACGIAGLLLIHAPSRAQFSDTAPRDINVFRKKKFGLETESTAVNPSFARATFANPSIEVFRTELAGSPKHGNHLQLDAVIKNIGTAVTPSSVIYKVDMKEWRPIGPPADWVSLGMWHGDPLKPKQSFTLTRSIKISSKNSVIRLTILSAEKVANSQDFVQFAEKVTELAVPTPDLGVVSLASVRPQVGPIVVPNGTPTFVAKIKNYGHQQFVADYVGGRSWKLSLAKGSKWELITEGRIEPIKLGEERSIDLLAALTAKYPFPHISATPNHSNLPHTFNRLGTGWKLEITGADANAGNDFKQLFFTTR